MTDDLALHPLFDPSTSSPACCADYLDRQQLKADCIAQAETGGLRTFAAHHMNGSDAQVAVEGGGWFCMARSGSQTAALTGILLRTRRSTRRDATAMPFSWRRLLG